MATAAVKGPAGMHINRLAEEESPYLLQHAHNPVSTSLTHIGEYMSRFSCAVNLKLVAQVDWYPWGKEAFAKARAEDKPIFLSVGYRCVIRHAESPPSCCMASSWQRFSSACSTCHWCHVMERESFENAHVAAIMNDAFVNVKVDREERPDVDKVYVSHLRNQNLEAICLLAASKPWFVMSKR